MAFVIKMALAVLLYAWDYLQNEDNENRNAKNLRIQEIRDTSNPLTLDHYS